MKTYEIENYYNKSVINLFAEKENIIEAETGRKALDKYLKEKNINVKVKVSSSNDVHFKVSPVVVENGKVLLDFRGGKRALWYQVQYQ
jgi:hypothetical protein